MLGTGPVEIMPRGLPPPTDPAPTGTYPHQIA